MKNLPDFSNVQALLSEQCQVYYTRTIQVVDSYLPRSLLQYEDHSLVCSVSFAPSPVPIPNFRPRI
jgi:hypothetical protein